MALIPQSASMRGHLAMLIFSAIVAGSFSFGSMIANKIDPVAMNAVRFMIAGTAIGLLAAMGPGLKRAYFAAPWRFVLLGAMFALYFVFMFEGLKTAPPVSTAAVFTLTPVMSGLFGWVLLRQRTTGRMWVALTLGAIGALWVIFRADIGALLAFDIRRGEAIYFVGCVSHAAFTPLLAKLSRGEPALVFNFGVMAAMVLMLTAYGAPAIAETDWAAFTVKDWSILIYIALFASALTFLLLRYSSHQLPSAKVMAYTYLVPTWVICWEMILGNGLPQPMMLIGIGLTVAALYLLLKDEETARPLRPAHL
ncbi:MAG: DMT family transporter [Rhodovulum sp.]|jgi:drug/metabolite transporter (DMT)-like permease|nr:EamA family transporter [Rhodovulum sp.]MCI5085308.1 DMT family transporter [Rhodovulum sp.]|tara:strand:+ start:972 stop:1898 length:927 start_codon:yes stop_codon:yes gene_type:complete